jgi:ATP-dependent DNA helicase RecG
MSKYLEAAIRYAGINRIEEYPYPEAAIREALLNAIAHKDYGSGNPIQIKVSDHGIIFWNAGQLPEAWTVDNLLKEHPSIPFNPDIATAFFRAGLIEAWGRGTLKILRECQNAGLPTPIFAYDPSGFRIEFKKRSEKKSEKKSEKRSEKRSEKILELMKANRLITIAELAESLAIATRNIEKHIAKLKEDHRIERVGPDKGGYWEVLDTIGD